MGPSRQQRLAALRDTIADIERKPVLRDEGVPSAAPTDGFPALPPGLVQEIFTASTQDSGANLGFALGQARSLLTHRRPTIFYVQLAGESQQLGLPYGPGLSWFGIDPGALVIVRAADMSEFLWAAEEVIACRAVAAIIADVVGTPKLLNFTASRRLTLRASDSKVSLFLLRYGQERESSASHLRWHLAPFASAPNPYDDHGLGPARWHLRLEKGRIAAGRQADWFLQWTSNGFALFDPPANTDRKSSETAFSRALPALLADRLSQAG